MCRVALVQWWVLVDLIEMKNMHSAVIMIAANVLLVLVNIASAGAVDCEADHQCDGGYCYLETGKCVTCVDCSLYLRQSSPWRTCARGPEDCGECLSGFEYDYLTDRTTRSFCVRKKYIEESEILNEKSPYLWIIIISILGLVISLLIYLSIKFYRVLRTRNKALNSNPDPEDPPPLNTDFENCIPPPSYDSSVPLLHQHSGVSSALVTSLTVVEKGGNSVQEAVPFSNPPPPYGTGGPVEHENEFLDAFQEEDNEPVVDLDDENDGRHAISLPELEDEDTMPSDWTPDRPLEPEEPHVEESISVTSSVSDVSNMDVASGSTNNQETLNDSGVSASCSHQSDLSCAHGAVEDVFASEQETTASNIQAVLHRCRSDEDLSSLSEIRDRKRQRRDSGSSSMKSVDTYREMV